MTALTSTVARWARPAPTVIGIPAIVATLILFRLAARQQPGYDPLHDTLSSLASEGAAWPGIAVVAMASAGLGTILASFPLRRVSQPAALALGVGGVSLFLVAFTRIACPHGAAGCAMGPETAYATATAHTTGLILFEIALTGAVASTGLCLWRAGARMLAVVAFLGIALSIAFFAVVPIDVGARQRVWLLVNTMLIAGAHVVRLPEPVAVPALAGRAWSRRESSSHIG